MLEALTQEPATKKPPLDTRVPAVIRIINGALDDDPDDKVGIVLNGRIDPETLRFLKVDSEYQRPLGDRPDIYDALKSGTVVPNIDIGVRGDGVSGEGGDYVITSPAYIIDGWQRVGTALKLLEQIPTFPLRLFATVHFGTDPLWERHRFTELNKNVKKVSPNLHLRNMRDQNEAVLTLFGLSNNTKDFALYKKVCWSQNMHRGELISASSMANAAVRLHYHHSSMTGRTVAGMTDALLRISRAVSLQTFRKNVSTFFAVIDECWGLRSIEFRHTAPQIKTGFLMQLAKMFSHHTDFWDTSERGFFVSADLRRKLALFPMQDPQVKNLAGSAGAGQQLLYEMIVSHVNSGKRTGRLRHRQEAKVKQPRLPLPSPDRE